MPFFFSKQTIIESLKYITTGEMPPGCARGASFIHDPKIAREMVVRGRIHLRVVTASGEKVLKTDCYLEHIATFICISCS